MKNIFEFIAIVFVMFIGATICTFTRGDDKNRGITIIILTILGTIFFIILRII